MPLQHNAVGLSAHHPQQFNIVAQVGDFDNGDGSQILMTLQHLIVRTRVYERESQAIFDIQDILDAVAKINSELGN